MNHNGEYNDGNHDLLTTFTMANIVRILSAGPSHNQTARSGVAEAWGQNIMQAVRPSFHYVIIMGSRC